MSNPKKADPKSKNQAVKSETVKTDSRSLVIPKKANFALVTRENRFYGAEVKNWDPNQRFFEGDHLVTNDVNLSKYLENAPREIKFSVISGDVLTTDTGLTFVEIENPFTYGED